MKRIAWTEGEIRDLTDKYSVLSAAEISETWKYSRSRSAIIAKARQLGLRKTQEWKAKRARDMQTLRPSLHQLRVRFPRGNEIGPRFLQGHVPRNRMPIGTIISNSRYLYIKIRDVPRSRNNFIPLHHAIWLASGRDIPDGQTVAFINADRTDFRLDNLICTSRAATLLRNTSGRRLPYELIEAALAVSELGKEIRRIVRNSKSKI